MVAKAGDMLNDSIILHEIECPKCHTSHWINWSGELRIECFNCKVPHAVFTVLSPLPSTGAKAPWLPAGFAFLALADCQILENRVYCLYETDRANSSGHNG